MLVQRSTTPAEMLPVWRSRTSPFWSWRHSRARTGSSSTSPSSLSCKKSSLEQGSNRNDQGTAILCNRGCDPYRSVSVATVHSPALVSMMHRHFFSPKDAAHATSKRLRHWRYWGAGPRTICTNSSGRTHLAKAAIRELLVAFSAPIERHWPNIRLGCLHC